MGFRYKSDRGACLVSGFQLNKNPEKSALGSGFSTQNLRVYP